MKLLLKFSFVFVIAWFASIGVKAQTDDILELKLSSADVAFVQDYNTQATDQTTTVTITASGKWTLSITAGDTHLTSTTTTDKFDLSKVTLTGFIHGVFGEILQTTGENNTSDNIYWHLDNLGNIFAGTYSVPVTFTLIKNTL